MELTDGFAVGFLGIFVAVLAFNQACKLYRTFWPPISRRFVRHIMLPRIFHGRHLFNPTRLELLCHLAHWTAVTLYNAYGVRNLSEAAYRAARLAIVHIVPLAIANQLSVIAQAFGLSLYTMMRIHGSLGVMAMLQAILHGVIELQRMKNWTPLAISGVAGMCTAVALAVLSLIRRYAYETFLWSHRTLAIFLAVVLWKHLQVQHAFNEDLWFITLFIFLSSSIFQIASQLYRNITWGRSGFRMIRTALLQHHNEENGPTKIPPDDEALFVELRLARPWNFQPGQFVYLSLMTLKGASIFQRHPFVVAWWESRGNDKYLYAVIDPKQGWTKSLVSHHNILEKQHAWLNGPYGKTYNLQEFDTVIFFASGSGIFAQLPLIKGLTEEFQKSIIRTRRMKLVWETDKLYEQLKVWVDNILDLDGGKHLDISVHVPPKAKARPEIMIEKLGERVKVIYDTPDVESYIQLEMGGPTKNVAVTVSGHSELRHKVRQQVQLESRHNVHLFELDFQPEYRGLRSNGTAA